MVEAVKVELLTPEKVQHFWDCIRRELDLVPHIWNAWWTQDSLLNGALEGRFQVWAAGNSDTINLILFTQISHYPANTVLQSILAIGNGLDEMMPMMAATLAKWAHSRGCTIMEVSGRPGLERKLRSLGFRGRHVTMMRPVYETRVQ